MTEHANHIRYYHFMAGVLARQQKDPLCGICKAFTNSVAAVSEGIGVFETACASEAGGMSREHQSLLADARQALAVLHPIPDATGQKKAGHCKLPQGVCFVKSSKALIDKVCP